MVLTGIRGGSCFTAIWKKRMRCSSPTSPSIGSESLLVGSPSVISTMLSGSRGRKRIEVKARSRFAPPCGTMPSIFVMISLIVFLSPILNHSSPRVGITGVVSSLKKRIWK